MNTKLNWHIPTVEEISNLSEKVEDKNLFSNDCSLASLILLQEKYNIQIAVTDDFLYRYFEGGKSISKTRTGYLFPIKLNKSANLSNAIKQISQDAKLNHRNLKFCLVSGEQKLELNKYISLDWDTNRNDSDYIYLTNELATLQGKNYHKKKNHLNHFLNQFGSDIKIVQLDNDDENEDAWEDALFIADEWLDENTNNDEKKSKKKSSNNDDDEENSEVFLDESIYTENDSIHIAVENHKKLDLCGTVIYLDDEPIAMTIASKISEQVLDVHFEKALEEVAKEGAYSAINYFFAKAHTDFLYLNREEDLGIEGLRKAKLSYKPEIILDKFYGE